jgi:ankyrin repeat protein
MDSLVGIVIRGEIEKLKEEHQNGLNIHFNDDFLLEEAASCNHLDIVEYLIENGANINSAGGMFGILVSYTRGHTEVNKYLVNIKTIELRKEKILKIKDKIKNKTNV